jgi:hypothetical protein
VLPAALGGKYQFVLMNLEPDHGQGHEKHDRDTPDQDDPHSALEHQCQPPTAARAA